MVELTANPTRTAGARERRRRAEALQRHRADLQVQRMAAAGELARVAGSQLDGRVVAAVVEELHAV
jgi:hypothetical protein